MNDAPTILPAQSAEDDLLFAHTLGPRNASILLVGEAWGFEESVAKLPFVGHSGKELDRMLSDAGLRRSDILTANLIDARPPGNDFTHFLYPASEKVKANFHGTSARPELLAGWTKLLALVDRVKPKLIIAAGNWPFMALAEQAGVGTTKGFKVPSGVATWRGSQLFSRPIHGRTYPVLPVIHPAAILREWSYRTVTVHDLRSRAKRFIANELDWSPPPHDFIIKPTWKQLQDFFARGHANLQSRSEWRLSVDLETYRRKWVSVIGLADGQTAIAIPLFYVDRSKGDEKTINYWDLWQEVEIFRQLKLILEHPNVRIIGQNFIYDTQWFYRLYGIKATVHLDTMVAHHLAFPGTPKSLDYLASLYCHHYSYWKDESGDWDNFPEDAERYWLYNCKDTRATYEAASVLEGVLKSLKLEDLYQDRMEQWALAREMMLEGVMCDTSLQKAMKLSLLAEANSLQEWLLNVVPHSWQYTSTGKPWFDSPKGTATILYQVLGLPQQFHKKTKQLTTDGEALAALRELPEATWASPLLRRLEDLRSVGVFMSHFLDARMDPNGRWACTFNVAHPETFRWSCGANGFGEGANLQTIPKGDE